MGDAQATCASCRAPVRWGTTISGRRMIFDDAPVDAMEGSWCFQPDGQVALYSPLFDGIEAVRYRPHWATCPHADWWRDDALEAELAGTPMVTRAGRVRR